MKSVSLHKGLENVRLHPCKGPPDIRRLYIKAIEVPVIVDMIQDFLMGHVEVWRNKVLFQGRQARWLQKGYIEQVMCIEDFS